MSGEPKKPMTDEEITEQEVEISRRIGIANSIGMTSIIPSLISKRMELSQLRIDRHAAKTMEKDNGKNFVVVDTDKARSKPSGDRNSKRNAANGDDAEVRPPRRAIPMPTSKPVVNKEEDNEHD